MITPQRSVPSSTENSTSEGSASTGRRVVRSVLESLATNVTPQQQQKGPLTVSSSERAVVIQRNTFTEVSTRTNRPRYADEDEGPSALEFLSPPRPPQPKPQKRASSVPSQRVASQQEHEPVSRLAPKEKEGSPLPLPNSQGPATKPVPLTSSSLAQRVAAVSSPQTTTTAQQPIYMSSPPNQMYTKAQVDELLKATLDAYVASRDEEEERVLSQATNEIEALQQMVMTLEEENKILIRQVEGAARARGEAERSAASDREASAEEVAGYKKAIGLLKKQCTDLTNATTELHAAQAEGRQRLQDAQEGLVRALEEASRASALHRDEMAAMQSALEEKEARCASELRIANANTEDARRQVLEVTNALERSRAEADAAREATAVARAEAEELRRQVSLQKSKCINVGYQRTAVESAKKEEVRDLGMRVQQLEEACKGQTEDLRKKLYKITSLEAQRDELRKQVDDGAAEMQRFGDKMSLVSQTVGQIVSAAEQLDAVLDAFGSGGDAAVGSGSGTTNAPNPAKRRLRVAFTKRATSSSGRSRSFPSDDGNTTFYQRVLATVSDVVQRLQPIQYVLRDAAGEVAGVLDFRASGVSRIEESQRQLAALRSEVDAHRHQLEAANKALGEARDRAQRAEGKASEAASEAKERLAAAEECRQRLEAVTAERDAACAELQAVRKARLEEKARLAASQQQQLEEAAAKALAGERASGESTATARDVEARAAECGVLEERIAALERDLATIGAAHEKATRAQKRLAEEKRALEEASAVSEREVNILHSKVRTLESANAGLRKKVASHQHQQQQQQQQQQAAVVANAATAADTIALAEAKRLHKEVEVLRRDLSAAREERAAGLAAAEEHASQLAANFKVSSAKEAEFLESIVAAVRRFIAASVAPYQKAVVQCAVACGLQQSAPPPPNFFFGNYAAEAEDTTTLLSPVASAVGHDTTAVVTMSPNAEADDGEAAAAASPFYSHSSHSHSGNKAASYASPPTPSRALLVSASPAPLRGGSNNGSSSSSRVGSVAALAAAAVETRAGVRSQLQGLFQRTAATLSLRHPQLILDAVASLREALRCGESEAEALRLAFNSVVGTTSAYSSSSYSSAAAAAANNGSAAANHSIAAQTIRAASAPSAASYAAEGATTTTATAAPSSSTSSQWYQQQRSSAALTRPPMFVPASPLPSQPSSGLSLGQRWSQASMAIRHHTRLNNTQTSGPGLQSSSSSGPSPTERSRSPAAPTTAVTSATSTSVVGAAPACSSSGSVARSHSSASSGPGLSVSPMDGSHSSPRRPPHLRSSSASATASSRRVGGDTTAAGPALQLPHSANIVVH